MKASLIVDAQNILGEGVQWNPDHRRVWWTDIHGKTLWSCDADGGAVETLQTPERLGSFAFDPNNKILAAFESGLFRWDIEGDKLERLTEFEPDHPSSRLNDGRCDRQGRFVVGGIDEDGMKRTSSVVRFNGRTQETLLSGIGCTNSICFSPDGRWMYFADSVVPKIQRFAYDLDTGALGVAKDFSILKGGTDAADGSCVDSEGAIWNARFGPGIVQRILPDGRDEMTITLDAPNVTCACFGGDSLDRLYITTARENMTDAEIARTPSSGGLFIAEPGVCGLPEGRFAFPLFASR